LPWSVLRIGLRLKARRARARLFVVWSPDRRESKKTRDEKDVGRNNESETLSRIISFNFLISKGKDDWKHSL